MDSPSFIFCSFIIDDRPFGNPQSLTLPILSSLEKILKWDLLVHVANPPNTIVPFALDADDDEYGMFITS